MRKTKIICTIGPATDNDKSIEKLLDGGMNIARLNFSHGTHESHKGTIDRLKKARKKKKTPLAIMLDTKGPEVRTAVLPDEGISVNTGDKITLVPEEFAKKGEIPVNYPGLPEDVKAGDSILIDDGTLALSILSLDGPRIFCQVENSGLIESRKGVNVPGVALSLPILSEKDKGDLLFGIKEEVDYIAASFVRNDTDVLTIRRLLDENGGKDIKIISKIENGEGVECIDHILALSDGVMVARGDLGVEVNFEDVPFIQKEIIRKGKAVGKPIIIATQMLDSMINNPRPTRAEVSDISNAIYESASTVMLSGETAKGKYPFNCLDVMRRTVEASEDKIDYKRRFFAAGSYPGDITHAVTVAAVTTAYTLDANAIIVLTKSGRTAISISRLRPSIPIVTITPSQSAYEKLAMNWGVIPLLLEMKADFEGLIEGAKIKAKEAGIVKDGDLIVIVAGVPVGLSGFTNSLRIDTIGDVIARGKGSHKGTATGRACVCRTAQEGAEKFCEGDILICPGSPIDMVPVMKKAAGIVLEYKDDYEHALAAAMALEVPLLTEAAGVMEIIKDGHPLRIDGDKGLIYRS
jgi:pyruvate kinase